MVLFKIHFLFLFFKYFFILEHFRNSVLEINIFFQENESITKVLPIKTCEEALTCKCKMQELCEKIPEISKYANF